MAYNAPQKNIITVIVSSFSTNLCIEEKYIYVKIIEKITP